MNTQEFYKSLLMGFAIGLVIMVAVVWLASVTA